MSIEVGDYIERNEGGKITRGVVTSNDRDGLWIMSTSGWNFHIPGSRIRVLSEKNDGATYADVKKRSDRHLKRFLKGQERLNK